jgi:hypothetical protein
VKEERTITLEGLSLRGREDLKASLSEAERIYKGPVWIL